MCIRDRDMTSAVRWFTAASESGDLRGTEALGRCYQFGMGTEKDETRAAELYRCV